LVDVPPALRPGLRRALAILLKAFNSAAEGHANPWDFAVEIGALRAVGVKATVLRFLVKQGYVQHAVEKMARVGKSRTFGRIDTLPFADRSCFVLTDAGVVTARRLSLDVPFYDRDQRELWARGQQVKRFRQLAPDQERILLSFQDLGWPRHIDNPLPELPGKYRQERLGGAIFRLNHRQQHALIWFESDGTGQGIIWKFTQQ
jgi:hypothetical protein